MSSAGSSAKKVSDVVRQVEGETDHCCRCDKRRSELEGAMMRCSSCRSSQYCSKACQVAHWKEHKKVCGQRVRARASLAASPLAALSPTFNRDWSKWAGGMANMLDTMFIAVVKERAAEMSRNGPKVKPIELAPSRCLVLNAEYTPGNPAPFHVANDYSLPSQAEARAWYLLDADAAEQTFESLCAGFRSESQAKSGPPTVVLVFLVFVNKMRTPRIVPRRVKPTMFRDMKQGSITLRNILAILNN